jgi:hypothetical protein
VRAPQFRARADPQFKAAWGFSTDTSCLRIVFTLKSNTRASTRAISSERIKTKLAECEFFLGKMHESPDPQEFGYYLSAFLAAFRTFIDLGLMRKHAKATGADQALLQLRKNSCDLDLLLYSRNVEVHREGVRIWLYRPSRPQRMVPRYRGGLWGDLLLTARTSTVSVTPRYGSRYGDGRRVALELSAPATVLNQDARCSFIFEDSGRDVLKACSVALDAVRSLGD